MDLPPDKAKVLRGYDDEKKWEMIRDQDKVTARQSPQSYLEKLKTYLDPKASRNSKKIRNLGGFTSTQVLRDLEISLRTNNIEWVREFLSEPNRGLDILIEYLKFRLTTQKEEQLRENMQSNQYNSANNLQYVDEVSFQANPTNNATSNFTRRPSYLFSRKHSTKVKLGLVGDDVHVCIMCMRAIMNNKFGFNLVMEHKNAINCIALSFNHKSLRTKSLVLELLAAVCLVKGGHQLILNAFDNFLVEMNEKSRFQTLMHYFMNYETFNIDFMVACMQFINIIVHSVEGMNFRVYLQYEFTLLGLDDYLENKLRNTESEELQIQIQAYLDNVFDVGALMEDAEQKNATLEHCQRLIQQLSHAHEAERDQEAKFEDLKQSYADLEGQHESLLLERNQMQIELNRIRQSVTDKEEESRRRESMLESKILELEKQQKTTGDSSGASSTSASNKSLVTTTNTASSPITPGPAAPIPPPPPPPPSMSGLTSKPSLPTTNGGGPIPPPPPPPPIASMFPTSNADMLTLKKTFNTKYKLPTFNWMPLKPNQVKGTVFNDFHNEEKIIKAINFEDFEEQFKLGMKPDQHKNLSNDRNINSMNKDASNTGTLNASKRYKMNEKVSLLEHNRLRNMAISMRKIDLETDVVVKAINSFDTNILSMEYTEVLLRMIPQPEEIKAYREYERAGRSLDDMNDVDKFLLQISKIERLEQKLRIMFYINNINLPVESNPSSKGQHVLTIIDQYKQRIQTLAEASRAIKKSYGLRIILEYILVVGNYMNCSTRTLATAPAYGFKLQTLDLITETKSSHDRSRSLLHYLVDVVVNAESNTNSKTAALAAAAAIKPLLSSSRSNHTLSGVNEADNVKMLFDFDKLFQITEKATAVSLETCVAEVIEIEKGMELCKNELNLRNSSGLANNPATKALQAFIQQKGAEVSSLRDELRKAQALYTECVEYFGENPKMMESSNQLFGTFVRFFKNFKQCQIENFTAQKKKNEEELRQQIMERHQQIMNAKNGTAGSEQDSNEMKVKEKRLLKQSEVYNGALEDILLGTEIYLIISFFFLNKFLLKDLKTSRLDEQMPYAVANDANKQTTSPICLIFNICLLLT